MRSHANRVPQAPNRKKITPEGGASYYATVENADNPVAEGAIVNKAMLDEFLAASGTTAGSGASFTLAQDGFSLFDGALVRVKLNRDMVAGATLNVNGTGAKAIVDAAGNAVSAGAVSGSWMDLIYNGSRWVLLGGEPGGRAQASYPVAQAVTAGEIVDIVGGKVTKLGNLQSGAKTSFTTPNFALSVASLPSSNRIVIARSASGSGRSALIYLQPLVVGADISVGTEQQIVSISGEGLDAGPRLYNVDSNKAMLTYGTYEPDGEGGSIDRGYFNIVRWDGSRLTSICSGGIGRNANIVKLSSSKAFIWYSRTMRELALGSTTASLGSTVTLNTTLTPMSIDSLSSTTMIAVNNSGKAAVLTVSGSSITTGPLYAFSTVAAIAKVIGLSSTRAVVVYGNKARVMTISGTTITMGPELVYCNTSFVDPSNFSVNRLQGNVFCITYVTTGIYTVVCDATTTTIIKKVPAEIASSQGSTSVDAASVNDNTVAIAYRASSSASSTGVVQLAAMTNASTQAIAMQSVSSGNVPVCFDGNISLPGKTRGQEIRSYDGQLVGYCYADGKVNVVGSWKR